jgi:hypothetical protein
MKSITVLWRGVGVGLVVQYLLSKSVTCLKTSGLRTATAVLLPNTIAANAVFQYRRCSSLGSFSCLDPIWFFVTSTVNMLLESFRYRFYFVAVCILLALCGLFDGGKLPNKYICWVHCYRMSTIMIYVCRNCKNWEDMREFAPFISEMNDSISQKFSIWIMYKPTNAHW